MPTFATSSQSLLNSLNALGRTVETTATGVMGSLQRAAAATGVDFNYLVKTATRESSLNPKAQARTSSAAGLFQFIDQTWLGTLKASGGKHGYAAYADQIVQGNNGRFSVPNAQARRQIMNLRLDADANAVMAAEMTAGHAAYLKGRIGRDPSQGELYVAHFLGPKGAADLINANETRPTARASALFPSAAHANPSIFYSHGRARSVAEVVANLTATGGNTTFAVPQAAPEVESIPAFGNGLHLTPVQIARAQKLQSDEMMMRLVFGDNGQQGLLFTTQLMSAFGPGEANDGGSSGGDRKSQLSKAFGLDDSSFG